MLNNQQPSFYNYMKELIGIFLFKIDSYLYFSKNKPIYLYNTILIILISILSSTLIIYKYNVEIQKVLYFQFESFISIFIISFFRYYIFFILPIFFKEKLIWREINRLFICFLTVNIIIGLWEILTYQLKMNNFNLPILIFISLTEHIYIVLISIRALQIQFLNSKSKTILYAMFPILIILSINIATLNL
jgi:hypothetical protein